MRVLLSTSWHTPNHCGIEEHSKLLIAAVQQADPEIEITPSDLALDPSTVTKWSLDGTDRVVHLNYHAALHSRWTPEEIQRIRSGNRAVLVTYHDTGVPNSDQCKGVIGAATAAVVHEPFDDLPVAKTYYWRMGVPELDGQVGEYTVDHLRRPILGTVGHDFPWKCWSQLCETAARAGWGMLIYCPSMAPEREAELRTMNPWLTVRQGYDTQQVLAGLRDACDATAFLFSCANTGQSASILQGVGARKPVLAFSTCRQFRALYLDPLGHRTVRWAETFEGVSEWLSVMPMQRFDAPIVALANQDSWRHLGAKYAGLYRTLVAET